MKNEMRIDVLYSAQVFGHYITLIMPSVVKWTGGYVS